jgi:hypothetical protein
MITNIQVLMVLMVYYNQVVPVNGNEEIAVVEP